ncbi:MAG: hypothetical protein H6Q44_825, partial [Deltaproteobacteria bacterium]|nr:hypothetical protein [Deltaproteobacteria bacterium]
IAVWDLDARNTPASHAKELTSILVSEIAQIKKFEAFSQENVRTLAGFTAERMMLGCTDSKCLTALGQMDIAKLISGSVGKIGNVYSISLNLFDTQNAKAENAISEFCRTEEELIPMVQRAVRKLLGLPVEASASILPPPPKPAAPPEAAPTGSASLEINSKVRGAQVLLNGQNMGEAPVRVFNINPGPHEIQVSRKGYEDFRQRVQVQPNEKKVLEANLKRLVLDEDYLIDKIFYFDNCAFGFDKFNHFIRFQKGGRLEGAMRSRGSPAGVSKASIDFSSLNGRWSIERNKIIIDFQMLKGVPPRRVMKIEVDVGPEQDEVFPARSESSTEYRMFTGQSQSQIWDGRTDVVNCQMREFR